MNEVLIKYENGVTVSIPVNGVNDVECLQEALNIADAKTIKFVPQAVSTSLALYGKELAKAIYKDVTVLQRQEEIREMEHKRKQQFKNKRS